jgi:cytoskeletal protein CcmA (bactofilin family)
MHEEPASIGKSIVISGELSGSEDLTIEGQVDGKIEFRDHVVTVGSNGRIKAQVIAKSIIVLGRVTGNLTATEKVDIREKGSVEGDIVAPRVAIADGSHFRGSIDMQRKEQPISTDRTIDAKASMPAAAPVNGDLVRV